ncbi:unnamed protein product [Caenorhabditis auriculariae]|uniref:Peptidase A2 domain-containing protein n=1 Tax=Caenorhabditis auriculariae TaxID=2777116 RepID=A0A8S1HXF0_9PELO|nr:unnamed protein product [Caenorhabditis auriculariae]
MLLTTSATAFNPSKQQWTSISIMFDSGADFSSISSQLVEEWGLTVTGKQTLMLQTFGTPELRKTTLKESEIILRTVEGKELTVPTLQSEILVGTVPKADLSGEDKKFISDRKLHMSGDWWYSEVTPDVIIGADFMFDMIDSTQPQHKLPSGTILIPTVFGYSGTGRSTAPTDRIFANGIISKESSDPWNDFWDLENAGIEDHAHGSLNSETERINQKVLKEFKETVQRREDGYYVKFPWKSDETPLPTHYAIAEKRLQSVINQQPLEVLKQIDDIFQDQLEKGIIEEVDTQKKTSDRIHYNPHQPVLTPGKETTKCRVVYDASCHFKNGPSMKWRWQLVLMLCKKERAIF